MEPEEVRQQVREVCMALPETTEEIRNPAHSGFQVKGKAYCYFLNDHHGDGMVSFTFKAGPGVQAALVDLDRERFYLPAYMARWGWVGMRLDLGPVDWDQLKQFAREAWLATAPKSLLKRHEAEVRAGL